MVVCVENYDELYEWSVKEISKFWAMVWQECEVYASPSYQQVGSFLE